MLSVFHKGLLKLDPEKAHLLAIEGLKAMQWGYFRAGLRDFEVKGGFEMPAFPGVRFANRIGMAAGFDKNAEVYAALALLGFGFVEVGTVTPLAQWGNPKPRIFRDGQQGLVNCLGFNNVGVDAFKKNLQSYRQRLKRFPVIANIGKGKNSTEALADYAYCLASLKDCVDGFVVNISSPNTPGLRDLQTKEFLEGLKEIIPVEKTALVKLAPDLSNEALGELVGQVAETEHLKGVVLTNTWRKQAEGMGYKQGGYSGPRLFERSLECVKLARTILPKEKVLIGVGGIDSLEKAKQMREAGADLIEIYTGFIYGGTGVVSRMSELV